jgi:hypothetical protein
MKPRLGKTLFRAPFLSTHSRAAPQRAWELGLHYGGNASGRLFVAEDPIGLAGGVNLFRYVNGNPLSLRDPLGLFSLLGGAGGSYVLGGGVEGSGGFYLNPGLFGQSGDFGVFGSGGYGGGLNISGDAFLGVIYGDARNVAGETINSNLSLGPVSVTVFYAPDGSGPIGWTIGGGPSVLPIGASGTRSNTVTWSISDWVKSWFRRRPAQTECPR